MALRFPKDDIGERLRRARRERGIDLEQAAADTRIDRHHLEALEDDAPLDEHHAGLYARIFLREYARYLGLDPKPLVGAYRATHPEPARPLIGGPPPVERRPGRWAAPVLAVLSAGALIALAVAGALRTSPDVPVPPETTLPGSPSPPAVDMEGESETPPPIPNRMILRVMDAPSWIRVSRDEEILLEGTHEPGFTHGFRIGDGLDVVLGNAGAVRLTAGGRSLGDLGDIGEVYAGTVVIERDGAELVP
jgi:cytoskeleton protein RodZ